jgi:RNA recognition motif-containing protein
MAANIRAAMEPVGKLDHIKVISKHKIAFVCFNSRESAEKAMEAMFDRFYIGQSKLQLLWAKAQLSPTEQKNSKKQQIEEYNSNA